MPSTDIPEAFSPPDGPATSILPYDFAFSCLLLVWAGMTGLNLGYVLFYGVNFPFADDLILLPVLSGAVPLNWEWLWEPINEHRFPLVRFISWAISRLTDYDIRFIFLFNAALASAAGLLLILSVRAWRGRSRYSDLICLCLTMSWMHWWNFLSGLGLSFLLFQFSLAALLSGILLQFWKSPWKSLACGLVLLSLPLNGGMGMSAALPMVPFFLVCAWSCWTSGKGKTNLPATITLVSALLTALVMLAYVGVGRLGGQFYAEPRPSIEMIGASLRVSSLSLGPWVLEAWELHPFLMRIIPTIWLGVPCVLVAAAARAGRKLTLQSLGFIAVMGAELAVIGAISYSRGTIEGNRGMAFWYVSMISMVPVCGYILAYRRNRGFFRSFSLAVFWLGAIAAFASGLTWGGPAGRARREGVSNVVRCIQLGYEPEVIAERYTGVFRTLTPDALVAGIRLLEKQRKGPFDPDVVRFPGDFNLLEFRDLRLTNWKGNRLRIESVGEGSTRLLKRGAYLESPSPDAAFTLPQIPALGAGSIVVRLQLQSSAPSLARLVALPSDPGAQPVERTLPCEVGSNVLDFVFADGEYENRQWRFVPGAEGGRYRLQRISILESPPNGFTK